MGSNTRFVGCVPAGWTELRSASWHHEQTWKGMPEVIPAWCGVNYPYDDSVTALESVLIAGCLISNRQWKRKSD